MSKEEQRIRFLKRIDQPEKNWKFSAADVRERRHWDRVPAGLSAMLTHTSTEWAPWYVLPADHKWFTRICAAAVIAQALIEIDPRYPAPGEAARQELLQARAELVTRRARGAEASKAGVMATVTTALAHRHPALAPASTPMSKRGSRAVRNWPTSAVMSAAARPGDITPPDSATMVPSRLFAVMLSARPEKPIADLTVGSRSSHISLGTVAVSASSSPPLNALRPSLRRNWATAASVPSTHQVKSSHSDTWQAPKGVRVVQRHLVALPALRRATC